MKKKKLSIIIWFTGLSGSGKTTLSTLLAKRLILLKYKLKNIDGDLFTKKKNNLNNFTKKNIINNNISIIRYIKNFYKNFDFTLVSVISPLKKTRLFAKKTFKKKYIEIYVKCSLKKLIKRDTKNLYKMAIENKVKNLIGFNSKISYEESKYKKLIINSGLLNKKKSIDKILKHIKKSSYEKF